MQNSDRYNDGLQMLKKIDGEAGEKVIASLKDISPELSKYIIEHGFGDIYSREMLDLKSKEIAVIAALIVFGTATRPQLKVHLNGALNTGSSINEVKEIILQMAVYAGFPCCINAMLAFKEVLTERIAAGHQDEQGNTASANSSDSNIDRLAVGTDMLSSVDATQVEKLKETFADFCPELIRFVLEFGYADIYARDNINKKYRQIATISALVALGNAQPQLKFHINAGINIGLSVDEVKEIILLTTIFAGYPAAINGMLVLKEVVAQRDL